MSRLRARLPICLRIIALTHAEAGEKAKADADTEVAIKHLEQAIDEGKKGNAEMATTHAEAALTHLEQAK
ncbi:MAG: small metal-binding protein SmbP [Methylocella sp.]